MNNHNQSETTRKTSQKALHFSSYNKYLISLMRTIICSKKTAFFFAIVYLLLLPYKGKGQISADSATYFKYTLEDFDRQVLTGFSSNDPQIETKKLGLDVSDNTQADFTRVFDPKLDYTGDGLHKWLCSSVVSEKNKDAFLRDALKNAGTIPQPFQIEKKCGCLAHQDTVKSLLIQYHKKLSAQHLDQSSYFLFSVSNGLSDADSLIGAYFEKWPILPKAYRYHHRIPFLLNEVGRTNESLQLIELILDNWRESGWNRYVRPFGKMDEMTNLFALIGFSENELARKEAARLAIRYMEVTQPTQWGQLGLFLQEQSPSEFYQFLEEKFHEYSNYPSTTNFDTAHVLTTFFRYQAIFAADRIGYNYWEALLKNRDSYGIRTHTFHSTLSWAAHLLLPTKLSRQQRISMVRELIESHPNILLDKNKYSQDSRIYHEVIALLMITVEKELLGEYEEVIPATYWKSFDPSKVIRKRNHFWAKPAQYKKRLWNPFDPLPAFVAEGYLQDVILPDYERCLFENELLTIADRLALDKSLISVDLNAGIEPLDYEFLFETDFKPQLAAAGITDISISQETIQQDSYYTYSVSVENGENSFYFTYSTKDLRYTKHYRLPQLTKAINRALLDMGSAYRLFYYGQSLDKPCYFGVHQAKTFIPLAKSLDFYTISSGPAHTSPLLD